MPKVIKFPEQDRYPHPEYLNLNQLDVLAEGHTFIHSTDLVYYMGEYISRKGWSAGPVNSHISNIKRTPSECSSRADFQRHKERSIREIAREFTKAIDSSFLADVTFVPIPPSKCKQDPEYDDRLIRILDFIHQGQKEKHVCELLYQTESTRASHLSDDNRVTTSELLQVLKVDLSLIDRVRPIIVLFDDILTTGRHYRAAREVIEKHKPETKFIGLFFARRVFD